MMKTFRVIFKDSSTIFVEAESINTVVIPDNKWYFVGCVEEVEPQGDDFISCSTPIKDSPYTLRRMNSGKLILLEHRSSNTDVSDNLLLNALEQHIQFLECHIYDLTKNQGVVEAQLREICGYVENGTDTTVRLYQDDATRSWHINIGIYKSYTGSTIKDVINNAYIDQIKKELS